MSSQGVDIRIRTTGAKRSAREVEQVGSKLGGLDKRARRATGGLHMFSRASVGAAGGLRLAGGAALYGGAALTGGLLVGLKRSTDAWNESRKVTAQTGAVLRSTAGVAKVTADEVASLSGALSRKTAVDDEAIQSGANLLLTFKKVRNEAGSGNDVFNRATAAAVDLSAAGFGSISSTSKQLGKALNDPIKGLTALSRAGVTFTQGQKDQITGMVESGHLLGAQKKLLAEVESQVKGSAAAQATPLGLLKVSWENVEEAIGKGVSPAVDALASDLDGFLTRATPKVDAFGARMGDLFGRKDISLGDKLSLAGQDLARSTGPLRRELEASLGHLDLGDKLATAFEAAAPRMADAAGRAAPRVAQAFANGFLNAGPYGQLFTIGLLSSKLGVFSTLGKLAIGRFSASWRARATLPAPTVAPTVPGTPGRQPGKPGKPGTSGVPVAAAGPLGWVATAGMLLTDPLDNLERKAGDQLRKSKTGRTVSDVLSWYPGKSDDPRAIKRVGAPALDFTKKGPRTKASAAGRGAIVVHVNSPLHLTGEGGRLLVKGVDRIHADQKARR